jgi:ankyrin repeat protein
MNTDHGRRLRPKEKALFRAIERRDLPSIRALLKEGVDPNAAEWSDYTGNHTVLMHAAGLLYPEAVELLLKAGADPTAATVAGLGAGGGYTALLDAINGSDPAGDEPDEDSDRSGRLKVVDLLLQAGADPYAVYDGEDTPVESAANAGDLQVVKLLIAAGADPKNWPQGCVPPLVGAAHGGHADIVLFLIEQGAPVDGETADGVTPLMVAAYRGAEVVLSLLLEQGAEVNHTAKDGQTPLIRAALYARDALTEREHEVALRVVKRLLEAGADLKVRDHQGKTALDYASVAHNPLALQRHFE